MIPVRIGAVSFLNARPLVYGLERDPRFSVRFDLPSRCADLLHTGEIDLGLIPSIEYLRVPRGRPPYGIVPDLAIASRGPVASVAIYTTRDMRDVRSIALDTSSRTSVALVRVLCARVFGISPRLESHGPDLAAMLAGSDAALVIGDVALFQEDGPVDVPAQPPVPSRSQQVHKIDLGEVWTETTGLPFVYAFWAGPDRVLTPDTVESLQRARAAGCANTEAIAAAAFDDPVRRDVGARYLRDNIRYTLGPDERAGLERFYRYAAEAGVVEHVFEPRFAGDVMSTD